MAIGDIHGCCRTMEKLLDRLTEYPGRTFVFIGDYIDRGPCSRQAVDRVMEFAQRHYCIFLRGNHEQMLLDALQTGDYSLWSMNGGGTTLDSYDATPDHPELPPSHMQFYRSTRMYYDTPDYFFVHAGLPAELSVAETLQHERSYYQEFLWDRSHLETATNNWEKTVVFGHTPVPEPLIGTNKIGIDTGCVFKGLGLGTLTAVLLPEQEFIREAYREH